MVMTAARRDFLAGFRVIDRMPLGDDVEVCWNVEQAIEDQGPSLAGKLLQGEDADVIVVHAQVAAMGFQLRVADLPVEMTRAAQRRALNLGRAEVHETPGNPAYPFLPSPPALT